jgi:hypothetical protein
MLGDQPALTPSQLIYQRLLAGDPIEAADQAREYLKTARIESYYDSILTGGLGLAAADNRLGHLDAERLDRITATVRELVDDLDGHEDIEVVDTPSSNVVSPLATLEAAETDGDETTNPRVWQTSRSILCIPAFGKLDEAAAIMLAQLLRRRGYGASAEQSDAMSVSRFFSLDLTGTELVCICYADRPSKAKLLYVVRRLTKKTKSGYVIALFLGASTEEVDERVPNLSVLTNTFTTALDAVEQKAAKASTVSAVAADRTQPAASIAG